MFSVIVSLFFGYRLKTPSGVVASIRLISLLPKTVFHLAESLTLPSILSSAVPIGWETSPNTYLHGSDAGRE